MSVSMQSVRETFPDAAPIKDFLDRVERTLAPRDFSVDSTLTMVSSCRDELTHPLPLAVSERMDLSFNLGGLGGMPSLGRTGWQAALSHVPNAGGRGHVVVIGMTHIGFGPDGTAGESLRRHQDHATSTCGALVAIFSAPDEPEAVPEGLDDHEKNRLRQLVAEVESTPATSIVEFTRRAATAVETEMWAQLEALEAWRDSDVAVFCGIQIHVDGEPDHIVVTGAQIQLSDGRREHLDYSAHD
jgi:hypothetical protein